MTPVQCADRVQNLTDYHNTGDHTQRMIDRPHLYRVHWQYTAR